MTPSLFAALQTKMIGSFADLVSASRAVAASNVLDPGTMVVKPKDAQSQEDERSAALDQLNLCNSVAPEALTTKMLQTAHDAAVAYANGVFGDPDRRGRSDTNLQKIREEVVADGGGNLMVARPVELTMRSLRGDDIVSKARGGPLFRALFKFQNPAEPILIPFCVRRPPGTYTRPAPPMPVPLFRETLFPALQSVVLRFQYEMLRVILERVGLQDLAGSIKFNEPETPKVFFPLGGAMGLNFDSSFRKKPELRHEGWHYDVGQSTGLRIGVLFAKRTPIRPRPEFGYGAQRFIFTLDVSGLESMKNGDFVEKPGGERVAKKRIHHVGGELVGSVAVCSARPATAVFDVLGQLEGPVCFWSGGHHFEPFEIVFASAHECAAAVKVINDLRAAAADEAGLVQGVIEQHPHYEHTEGILRASFDDLAWVLDCGPNSWALHDNTTLFETVNMVNSQEYREYHGFNGGNDRDDDGQPSPLRYELFVSVKSPETIPARERVDGGTTAFEVWEDRVTTEQAQEENWESEEEENWDWEGGDDHWEGGDENFMMQLGDGDDHWSSWGW